MRFNEKEKKISEVSEFSILLYTQNRNSEISESFILLQFLVVYETQDPKSKKKST